MAQQVINIGAAPNDGTGDALRTAFGKCQNNFDELYEVVNDGGLQVAGTWDGPTLKLGVHHLWVDADGHLRINNGPPASETDGAIVGAQS